MNEVVRRARRDRYQLLAGLRGFTTSGIQARCGRPHQFRLLDRDPDRAHEFRYDGRYRLRLQTYRYGVAVFVESTAGGPVVRLRGLVRCERLLCPVCGPLMWTGVARDLQRAITAWQAGRGEVLDVTLRLAPLKRRDLQRSLDTLLDGWDAVIGRAATQKHRMRFLGLAGYHQQQLIGIDPDGRWDPCLRALLFMNGHDVRDPQSLRRLANAVWDGWVAGNHDVDLRPPTRKRGLAVSLADHGAMPVAHTVASYVSGTGALPSGTRSGIEVLAAACSRNGRARALWDEVERAARGRTMRRWKPGMRRRLGLTPDTTMWPQRQTEPREVAVFTAEEWDLVYTHMPAPIEVVEDALAAGEDPYRALAGWSETKRLPVPRQPNAAQQSG